MTIQNREAVARYQKLLRCVEEAPDGTFTMASDLQSAVQSATCEMESHLREMDLDAGFHGDAIVDIEALIYAHIIRCNPKIADDIAAIEGFAEHVDGPARDRVKAGIIRDRDFLASLRA